jgi:hypothetical protein
MANIVRASEDGATGHPGEYRDYWLPPPSRRGAFKNRSAGQCNQVTTAPVV